MHVSLITLAVTDLDASTRFYEALGWQASAASVAGQISFLRGGTVMLGLFPADAFGTEVGHDPSTAGTPVALATNVSSDELVDAFLAAALRSGATIVRPATRMAWGGYSGYFADPDGHVWEVAHNPHAVLAADGRLAMEPGDAPSGRRGDADGASLVDELADRVLAVVDEAAARLDEVFAGIGTDKAIATMTELAERSLLLGDGSGRQMRLAAASTLVSGRIGG